jgi:hypothetical protein
MDSLEKQLWYRIRDFRLDLPGAALQFTDRLRRENDWEMSYAVRAVMEYKRFMFLIACSDRPLTPSDQVDQVWHLHLLYTISYWKEFCQGVLGMEIHHGPTKGGVAEQDKFAEAYERTMTLYRQKFERVPPEDIWPPTEVRFAEVIFSRVNRHRYWVIPKPNLFRR